MTKVLGQGTRNFDIFPMPNLKARRGASCQTNPDVCRLEIVSPYSSWQHLQTLQWGLFHAEINPARKSLASLHSVLLPALFLSYGLRLLFLNILLQSIGGSCFWLHRIPIQVLRRAQNHKLCHYC